MKNILTAMVASAFLTIPANAVTITFPGNGPDNLILPGETLISDFSTTAGLSGGYELVTGSVKNQYAAPLADLAQYIAVRKGQEATLALGGAFREVSFYWGSIDKYNNVLFLNNGILVGSFTGVDVLSSPSNGSQTSVTNNRRVSFSFDGAIVTDAVFASSRNSFELGDVRGLAVPEPATWAMLVTGFGFVGAASRRSKNRLSAVVSA